jgi:SAM-dependent methyltransferase
MWNVYEGAEVLDVGCATGQTLSLLAGRSPHRFNGLGIDISGEMTDLASERFRGINLREGGARLEATMLDASTWVPNKRAWDVTLALFALQFIPTPARWRALDMIREHMRSGGLFILAEKTIATSPRGADLHAGLYSDWKLQNGVKPDEVVAKWSSLRGQLIPWYAHDYEDWARRNDLEGDLIWCWGPFRAWAWWDGAMKPDAPDTSGRAASRPTGQDLQI